MASRTQNEVLNHASTVNDTEQSLILVCVIVLHQIVDGVVISVERAFVGFVAVVLATRCVGSAYWPPAALASHINISQENCI